MSRLPSLHAGLEPRLHLWPAAGNANSEIEVPSP